jgi:hypothetical protein
MSKKTTAQIEKELADLKTKIAEKEKALEEQKLAEIAELKAQKEKGIRDAWDTLCSEFVKAGQAAAPDLDNIESERGKKMAVTKYNKKCYELLGEVLGLVQNTDTGDTTHKTRKGLNADQKAKIEQWVKDGVKVAEMNKKCYTNPTPTTYQRINNYVKKLKKS